MTSVERLQAVQRRLLARGVKDVKFTLAPDVHSIPKEKVIEGVAEFLEDYLEGNYKVVPKIQESCLS